MTSTRTLDIANALQHADTRAARYDDAAHLYLDLAEALIDGPDEAVRVARARVIRDEIHRYHSVPESCDCDHEEDGRQGV